MEELEPRTVPATTIKSAFGAGVGGGPVVTVMFDDNTRLSFQAFPSSFTGGVSAVLGRVNGNPVPDVIVGTARGAPEVEVFNGRQLLAGVAVPSVAFFAFSPVFTSGVTLATGEVNGTGHSDVIVANGAGAPPLVSVYDGAQLAQGNAVATATFSAFAPQFLGGVSLAVGNVNGTSHADVIVGAGPGGGPEVRVIDGAQLAQGKAAATAAFNGLPANFTGGVVLAVGQINGTNHADVVVGARAGAGPQVQVFDGAQLSLGRVVPTASFFAFTPSFGGGVTLAVGNVNGTGHADVVAGAGPGGGPEVAVFDGAHLALGQVDETANFFALPSSFRGGVQVLLVRNPGAPDTIVVVAGPGGGPQVVLFNPTVFVSNGFFPFFSFFAFAPFFLGGVNLGYNFLNYGGCGCAFNVPAFGGTSSQPGFTAATGGTGFSPGGFTSGGFTGGGFTGGFSGGGFSGGGSGGGSLRAAGGGVGRVGGKAPGGGLYLGVGMVATADEPLSPEATGPLNGAVLSSAGLRSVLDEAVSLWDAAGITPAQDHLLRQTPVRVAPLGSDLLGHTQNGQITLSPTAAGFGWYVDPLIPLSSGASPPLLGGHMDLATVVAHEMGLVLGLKETGVAPDDIMAPFLPAGVRRLPTTSDLDTFFMQS